jgi:site-specific recombinase XerC
VSVERAPKGSKGLPYSVRWRDENGRNRRRRFASKRAAEKFDERVKDLRASGELHLLDETPRGTVTLLEYTWDVWWPEYAEVHLGEETRAVYATQLDLRILPKWGRKQLRELRAGPIEAWVGQLRRQGVGDPTIIKTLTVFRAILKRAERDEEIERNPIPLVAKPKQKTMRAPKPIPPLQVERLRARLLDPPRERDRRGRLVPVRDPRLRMMDATLVSLLAYAGPRPESEALPMRWEQIGRATITFRATKSGKVLERETRLLRPLARDLAEWRLRSFGSGPDELVFPSAAGEQWSGDDWDNWRERIFRPAAIAVGCRKTVIPRDLRGSFASLLIWEGKDVLQVAPQLGHSAQTCLDYYGREFEEFAGLEKRPAEDVIAEAREQVARGDVPTEYPAAEGGPA